MMNRRVWTGTCAAMISLATAGMLAQAPAQTPAQPPAQTPAPQQSAPSSSDKKIVVTGCLKAAPAIPGDTASAANPNPTGTAGSAAAGATGTSGTAPDAKFILTGATLSTADSTSTSSTPSTSSTSSTSSTPSTSGTAQTYRLIANPTALTEHVGKKLELTGTLDPASTADPKDPSAAAPALRVQSGKIVAASCSE
jgi:hypothetical protein